MHPRQLLQLDDLSLQLVSHRVERRGELRQVVLPAHAHALFETARRQRLRSARCHPDRCDNLTRHQRGNAREEQDERETGEGKRAADQAQRVLLLLQREEVVELVDTSAVGVEQRAHGESRTTTAARALVVQARVGVALLGRRCHERAQGRRDACVAVVTRFKTGEAWIVRARPRQDDHVEQRRLATAAHDVAERVVLRVRVGAVRGVELLLCSADAGGCLCKRDALLGVEQAVLHLVQNDEAEQSDNDS